MSDSSREDRNDRDQLRAYVLGTTLRAYLLGTLPEAERAELESRLAASEELRTRLEAERAALAKLDALPEAFPLFDLTPKVMAKVRAQEAKKQREGRKWYASRAVHAGMAAAIVIIVAAIVLPALERPREASRAASSQNNMKQLGIILKMYANESKGEFYPPLAPQEGVWGLDVSAVYPEYLTDINVLVDPRHPRADELYEGLRAAISADPIDWATVNRLAAESYTYLGWSVNDEGALARLKEARPQHLVERMELAQNLETASQIYRLREGIERFFISDINTAAASTRAQADIPVMFETHPDSTSHKNVLYMDGHVEWVPYGKKFPATPETDRILGLNSGQ